MELQAVGEWGRGQEAEEGLLNGHHRADASPNLRSRTPMAGHSRTRLLRQFCETSSLRSVPRIVRAPTGVQRLLWVLALLAGVAMTTYQLFNLLGMYFSYRTSINMIHVKTSAPFPDVTVCNLNPLWEARTSRLNVTWTYEDYLQRLQDYFSRVPNLPPEQSYVLDSLQTYEGYLQYFSEQDLNQVQDHLVWDCRWEYGVGMPPSSCVSEITRHVSPYYGPCSTFQAPPPSLPHHSQPSRLTMMLFVNDFTQGEMKDFFLSSYFTYSSGVRLLVHPPGTFPLMDEGVNLPPGHESTVTAHTTRRILMGKPYGKCVDKELVDTKYGSKTQRYAYTDRVCNKFCQQDHVIKNCACVDPYTPFPKFYRGLADIEFCGFLDLNDVKNINITLNNLECLNYLEREENCDCPQPCRHYLYDIEVSQVPWPHVNYHLAFYHKYLADGEFGEYFRVYREIEARMREDRGAGFEEMRRTDLIRRNFLEISVILDGEQTTLMEDYPNLSLESLFGNMGGILNLWVGITFVTAVEVMDLLWTCLAGDVLVSLPQSQTPREHPHDRYVTDDDRYVTDDDRYITDDSVLDNVIENVTNHTHTFDDDDGDTGVIDEESDKEGQIPMVLTNYCAQ